MFLPHMTALKLASKSSPIKTRSEASLAAATPDPIEIPTSDLAIASRSLIPSPVAATFLLSYWSPTIKRSLSVASALARTLKS
jgi:hypothetical protein